MVLALHQRREALDAARQAWQAGWRVLAAENAAGLDFIRGAGLAGTPAPSPQLPDAVPVVVRGQEAAPDWLTPLHAYAEQEFRQGYRDFGGNPAWEEHFVTDVILGCENSTYGWVWHPEASHYITVAQFHPASWATAARATELDDPNDPYHVGAAVAWWSNAIEHPGGTGGWPTCWWEGVVP